MDDKSEPRENDKCMEQGESAGGGMSKLRAQVTSAVANIPSLVIVLLCVLLLVFFVIIVALSVKVHSGSTAPEDRCLSAACLGSASRVLAGLGREAAPCREPYALACRAPGVPRGGQHAVRHLVDLVPFDGDQASAETKAKRFYETCMEPRSLSQDALALLNYRLRQVGGWELVAGSSWSLQGWDRDTALEKLHVDLGVSPFFAIGVADRTIRVSRRVLFVSRIDLDSAAARAWRGYAAGRRGCAVVWNAATFVTLLKNRVALVMARLLKGNVVLYKCRGSCISWVAPVRWLSSVAHFRGILIDCLTSTPSRLYMVYAEEIAVQWEIGRTKP
ncbi:hypothetical protein HPB49_015107 [Dermacentor silvarum]|uniref:Uncharacterized protein n=1 Tax=Dermacentor silvarum TaxID=543639 RepID=A0ACB8D6B7_DERSI|nr:hypothetical protein HPB49_015107 [Dermacentor silvarum]